jgi:hypothetical protein
MARSSSTRDDDVEKNSSAAAAPGGGGANLHFTNDVVRTFGWEGVTVTVKDRTTNAPRELLSNVNGVVKAGESREGLWRWEGTGSIVCRWEAMIHD